MTSLDGANTAVGWPLLACPLVNPNMGAEPCRRARPIANRRPFPYV
jgi:hypothetical protein